MKKKTFRPAVLKNPSEMTRVDIIRFLLHERNHTAYLEIGVRRGDCFKEIRARNKVAVDPKFQIRRRDYWYWNNLFCSTYFECTSDEFFSKRIQESPVQQFDVIFIDGLHTHEQSWKDIQHSLPRLKSDGWILLHDCNPLSETAAVPACSYQEAVECFGLKDSLGAWNGDVWKSVIRLRMEYNDLKVVVLDCDEGICLIHKGVPESSLNIYSKRLSEMTYDDLDQDRINLLNLKSPLYLLDAVH